MCDLPHNSRLPFTSKRPQSVIDIGQTFAATRTIRLESPLKLIRVGTRNSIYNETGHPSAAQTQRRFNVDNTVAKNVSSIIPACHVSAWRDWEPSSQWSIGATCAPHAHHYPCLYTYWIYGSSQVEPFVTRPAGRPVSNCATEAPLYTKIKLLKLTCK